MWHERDCFSQAGAKLDDMKMEFLHVCICLGSSS